jgi:hypothetical protein
MRRLGRRRCVWCSAWFGPNHRLKDRQKSCGADDCKRKQKQLSQRRWQRRAGEDYRKDQRDWRKDHADYWKTYRDDHPAYAERNRIQSKIRWRLSRQTLQNRIDILEVTEKTMEFWDLPHFAKRPRSICPLLWAYTTPHEFENHSQPEAP